MKKSICLLMGFLLLTLTAGCVMAVEAEVTDTVNDALPQNVQNQLDIAMMALELANTEEEAVTTDPVDPVVTEETEETEEAEDLPDPAKMEDLAERHAFIAWAHYNHVPASRKLQEEIFNKTVEVERTVTEQVEVEKKDADGNTVKDSDGNPVYETVDVESVVTDTMSLWDQVKGQLKAGEIDYAGILEGINTSVPEVQGLINGEVSWGQYKKSPKMNTLKTQSALKTVNGKALGKDKEKEDHGNKGGDNGNKGGNGKGKDKDK